MNERGAQRGRGATARVTHFPAPCHGLGLELLGSRKMEAKQALIRPLRQVEHTRVDNYEPILPPCRK